MSSESPPDPSLNVLRRLSRPVGRTGSSGSPSPHDPPSSPFKRLKSQLGKRRSSKEKGKAVERTPSPQTTLDPIPQSDETPPVVGEPGQNTDTGSGQAESGEPDTNAADDSQTMSTTTLARRIHALLSPFPSPYTLSPSGSFLPPQTADSAHEDSAFFSLLASVSAMNGSISKGRESVWGALERLRYLPHAHAPPPPKEGEDAARGGHDDGDVSSVMICGPLRPEQDTEVEIARSEVVSVDLEGEEHGGPPHVERPKEQGVGGVIPWLCGAGTRGAEPQSVAEKALPPPPRKTKQVRVWHPSRTKVSLEAFWWGYRIYLPPPVMRVLSDRSLEAAKRAAMITGALTWLVTHLPAGVLPPQMGPVFGVLKQIVPVMGYVGAFIAWSWNTVQGFDKGQGVTLSATWLLPIALVPGTWFYEEPPSGGVSSGI